MYAEYVPQFFYVFFDGRIIDLTVAIIYLDAFFFLFLSCLYDALGYCLDTLYIRLGFTPLRKIYDFT